MEDLYRIIGDSDTADGPIPEDLKPVDLLKLFEWLVLLRTFDERAVALQRQGRLGTYPMFWGEEATQAGPLYACRDTDWVFPSYRQGAVGILRGLPPSVIFNYRRGFGGHFGFWNPRRYRVGPSIVSIATHLSHAVGVAWAAKLRRDDLVSLVWFGDGATSEGDFHEAMNFASVMQAPVILFCTNNQWAISTPFHRQTATDTIAQKGAAYAMPSARVDGFDPVACFDVTRGAIERARSGGGPTLIEAFCYRLAPHGTADDPKLYRDESVTDTWRALEPVGRMAAYMRRQGLLDDVTESKIRGQAKEKIDDAVSEMENVQETPPEILFDTLYASGRPVGIDDSLGELRPTRP